MDSTGNGVDTKSIKRWYEMLKEKMQRNKRHVREHLVGTGIPPIRHSMNYKGGGLKFTPSREVPLRTSSEQVTVTCSLSFLVEAPWVTTTAQKLWPLTCNQRAKSYSPNSSEDQHSRGSDAL
ncbi:hypothetical protein TNCV_1233191 [Trichonephila clavipes]|nr:hypothetical protein TNCV_1233191 [Trichonephila clavipes]